MTEHHDRLKAAAITVLGVNTPHRRHYISTAAVIPQGGLHPTSQLDFDCQLSTPLGPKTTTCLVDTGASACFISRQWALDHQLPRIKTSPIRLTLADGNVVESLTEAVELPVTHGSHTSTVLCYVASIGRYNLILGMNWMDCHNPAFSFGTERSMTFDSPHCHLNCLHGGMTETVYGDRRLPDSHTRKLDKDTAIMMMSAHAAYLTAKRHPEQIIWVEPHHWEKLGKPPKDDCGYEAFRDDIARCAGMSQDDFDKYMEKHEKAEMTDEELKKLVPDWLYSKMKEIFSLRLANHLPPRRPGIDHVIDVEASKPPRPHIYGLTRQETEAVKKYIDEMMGKGFIRPSSSPYASPVLVVKKPGGGLRICVDYRGLNAVTKKNRNAPPSIKETLARMAKVRIMSIVNVIAAFNSVRIKDGDEEKTAFQTRYRLYEYLVMPFGLCNALGTFQTFINETLREHLDDICSAYLDDVLIYSEDESLYEGHVLAVLQKLKDAGMYLDAAKCKFKVKRVKYLGLILTTDGLEMDPKKVATIKDWSLPRTVKDVQSFLGFANFYRRFIKGFSYLAKALTELTRKDLDVRKSFPLADGSAAFVAFYRIKEAFATAGVLAHFDPDLESWLETDASDFVTAAILSQMGPDNILRPVAFLSRKMTPAECNYEIYDKELLAIVQAFEEWRFELAGTKDPIKVLSDHQALQTFMTNKRLNRRQARWAEFLAEFNFHIKYRPGKQGTKPDALTRRPGDLPADHNDERRRY